MGILQVPESYSLKTSNCREAIKWFRNFIHVKYGPRYSAKILRRRNHVGKLYAYGDS